jgi:glycine dehydrogenase subunit 2
VKSAPHNQPVAQVKGAAFEDPALWAMTWRAFQRKRAAQAAAAE